MAEKYTDAEAGHLTEEAPPPTYTQSQNEPPPPTYESLYGEIKAAQRNSSGRGNFLKNVCVILGGTLGATVILAISLAIPIAMIVIGALNLGNCRVQRFVPIWLIVGGSVGALMQLISLGKRFKKKDNDGDENNDSNAYKGSCSILGCFNVAWFIAGNVWVYSIYPPNTVSPGSDNYCDFTTYYMAFGLITAAYVCLLFVCCCSCCIAMCAGAAASSSDD